MGTKGLRGRNEDPSDVESERDALRRQRVEAAAELGVLKQTLSERVAQVQQRERELADALARVEKREQKLDAAATRGSRLDAVRLRLAEAKQSRATPADSVDSARVDSTQAPAPAAAPVELDARTLQLDVRETELADEAKALAERESELETRKTELEARAAELTEHERSIETREEESVDSPQSPEAARDPDEFVQIEEKLAELGDAEQAFARTQHELAARSEALAEREAELTARERALAEREAPEPTPDLEALESRIRRLEQGGRGRPAEQPTFSAGLRTLETRGLRGGRDPDEPLH
ncbi:MAG: hypothetical protein ABIR67_02915 [Gaiellaceae bacterium]